MTTPVVSRLGRKLGNVSDGKYFSTTKKGEIHELKEELNSLDRHKKKEAVKKVIAAMTVGKDVSMLFPDVVNCMQTDNLELKKLVYLYLINYAKTQPDLAIMAVNTFVKDSQDPNPLIRALAVRTMGCIRVDKITEYLCDPLQKCLRDDDPYVRKTAAICVSKLYDISPEIVEDRGFLDILRDLISDSNPMVVANAVASLGEIQEYSSKPVFQLSPHVLYKLLAALNECTEWGQVFILDALGGYDTTSARDAESIVERVAPRLQHANCAVVLGAVKVILRQLDLLESPETAAALLKKMAPPLVTLLSAEPELQYVALRNINLICQKRPGILANDIKVFFCKYNDPLYVKMEKLEMMIKLASERNIDQVLLEFKEYATEIDVEFVRKAVRAIGRCAVAIERSAEACINVLLELIQTKVNYVVQEAICVIKDIFRRYPNQYESIIATLCENLDTLDEPEAKAAMIWIIGEYAERIDNADELLETFLETFLEEAPAVQLQLLTATVKLFLKKPTEGPQNKIQMVLNQATQGTDNPDLRDRAYVYWRLLSTDPEAAKDVVLAEKPTISDDSHRLDPTLLDHLLANIGTLASVYHKAPEAFVTRTRQAVTRAEDLEGDEDEEDGDGSGGISAPAPQATSAEVSGVVDLMGDLMSDPTPPPAPAAAAAAAAPPSAGADLLGDLLSLSPTPAAPPPAAAAAADPFALMHLGGPAAPPAAPPAPIAPSRRVLLAAANAQGLEMTGCIARTGPSTLAYDLAFKNGSTQALSGFQLQFNKNSFGLAPAEPLSLPALNPGASANTRLPLAYSGAVAPTASLALQIAIKNQQQPVWYFTDTLNVAELFLGENTLSRDAYLATWKQIPDAQGATTICQTVMDCPKEVSKVFAGVAAPSVDALTAKLQAHCVFFMASRPLPETGQTALYFSLKLPPAAVVLVELTLTPGVPGVKCCLKTATPTMSQFVIAALEQLML